MFLTEKKRQGCALKNKGVKVESFWALLNFSNKTKQLSNFDLKNVKARLLSHALQTYR